MILWQADKRWRGAQLGHGPSKMGASGCVLFALLHAAERLRTLPAIDPVACNDLLRAVPGAFVDGSGEHPGDLLYLPKAATVFGLVVDQATNGKPGEVHVAAALSDALRFGLAIVRVTVDGDDRGDHSILATQWGASGVECVCSALADVVTLERPSFSAPSVHWGSRPAPYRMVGVRPIRLAPAGSRQG